MSGKDERRKEQELIDGIFRTTPGIILVLDAEGRIVSFNPYLEELSGYELAEVKGENWFKVFLPEREKNRIGQVFTDTIKELKTSGTINTITTRDGRELPIEWHNRTLRDESDSVIGVVSIGHDITGRVRAEWLKRIQRDLALAIGSTSSLDDVLNRILEAALRIEGVDSGGVYLIDINTGDLDVVTHRGLSQKFADAVAHYDKDSPHGKFVHAGKSVYREYPALPSEREDVLRAEGLHALLVIPILFEGEVVAALNLASHTDEMIPPDAREALETIAAQVGGAVARVRAEVALRESEERFRKLSQAAEEGVVIHDKGIIIDANEALARMFGYKIEELIGKNAQELATPESWDAIKEKIATESEEPYEGIGVREDGSTFNCRLVGKPYMYGGKALRVGVFRDITENKLAEKELRLMKFSVDRMSDAAFWMGPDARLIYVNDAACNSLGYTREELLSMTVHDVDPVFTAAIWQDHWEDVKRRRSFTVESQHRARDGRIIPVEIMINYLEFDGKEYNCAFARDITDRKKAEKAIRESEERFSSIFRAAPICIGLLSDRVFLMVNDLMCQKTGYSREELIGQSARILYATEEEFERVGKLKYADIEKYGIGTIEARWKCKDGGFLDMILSSTPLDPSDLSKGVTFTAQDITDRKKAEDALKASEAEKLLILDSVSELVNFKDTDLKIKWVNKAGAEMLNMSTDEIVGMNCYELWGGRAEPCPDCSAMKVIETGEPYDCEMEAMTGRIWQVRGYPVKDANNKVIGVVEVSQDITERKQSEKTLLRLQKLESLSVLAGGIAHDFNNLLMGILGYAEIAKMELGRESPALHSVEQIERSALHAADLTKQMLAYSGKGQFVVEPIDVSKLIDEMDHLLMAAISKKSLLKFNLEKNLPAIEADATQVRQVLMNLVTNASDAIGDGSGIINVSTGVMDCNNNNLSSTYLKEELEEGLYVFLEVADTGIGMDDQTVAKIFDPFFTTKFTGRGLGLAAVLGIIRGHNGAVKVSTEPGRGTAIRVLFPCTEKDAVEAKKEETRKQVLREGVTILVVDDEESVRTVSKLLLEKAGANVITANDGHEGVEILMENPGGIDAVLLDMTMPRMGGQEAFAEMRKIKPDIRIVLTSGYTELDVTDKFEGKGLAGFIQKPYRPGELVKKMVELLGD